MRVHLAALWIGAMLLFFSQLAGLWTEPSMAESASAVGAQRHFRAILPPQPTDILSVIQTAQGQDYWIRIQTGFDVTYFKGQMFCMACTPAQEDQFFTPPELYVDGQSYWVRLDDSNWRVNLRPSSEAPMNYELIISPKVPKDELNMEDVRDVISMLSPFVHTQAESLSFEPLLPPTKPEPPEGAHIDSVLYGLTLSPDWKDYANANGIELSGLRTAVIVDLNSADAQLSETLNLVVEARNGSQVRVQAFIHQLVELSRDPAVSFVRSPSRPQPPSF